MRLILTTLLFSLAGLIHAASQPTMTVGVISRAQGFQCAIAGDGSTTACLKACDGLTTATGAVLVTTATTTLAVKIVEGAATTCTLTVLWGPGPASWTLGR